MHPPATPEYTTQAIGVSGPFFFQAFLNLGNAILKLALLGSCPSAQNQSHGQIVHKPMLFAECDCRVSLACDNGSLTAKLMHPEAYRSCHCLAECARSPEESAHLVAAFRRGNSSFISDYIVFCGIAEGSVFARARLRFVLRD